MRIKYRLFSVLCAALLVAGCTKLSGGRTDEDVLAAVTAPFSFTGTATMEGMSQPVRLKATKAAMGLTLELLEPETVKGLVVELGGQQIKTTFRGLTMSLSPDDIPQQSLFITLWEVLSCPPGEDTGISEKGGLVTVDGNAGMLPYQLIWSAEELALQVIKLPSVGGIMKIDSFIKTT